MYLVIYHNRGTNNQTAAQQRHAPNAATRPETGGILRSDFVLILISIH